MESKQSTPRRSNSRLGPSLTRTRDHSKAVSRADVHRPSFPVVAGRDSGRSGENGGKILLYETASRSVVGSSSRSAGTLPPPLVLNPPGMNRSL